MAESVTDAQSSFGNESTTGGGDSQSDPVQIDTSDDNSLEAGLFGVLYTVSKEKHPHAAFVAFRLFMDWIQVFLLTVNPAYGWNIDAGSKLWRAFSFIQLNYFMSVRGYVFFLICMYSLAAALATNLGLCVWVAHSFKNNSFNHVWPIVWLRYFSLVFYQVLDIASLTLFLMTMDCQYFAVDKAVQGRNQQFPEVYCWKLPHIIHVTVAATAVVIFVVLATVFTMAEIELNPVSRNLIGMAHTKVEVQAFVIKTFMTCVSVFVTDVQWMSPLQLIGSFCLCYLYLKWLPHLHAAVNHVRVGSCFSVFWAALLFVILAYRPGLSTNDNAAAADQAKIITIMLWAMFFPVGLGGAALSWWRTRFFNVEVRDRFRNAPRDTKTHRIFKFTDPREVEIMSRCCRVWIDEDTVDPEVVSLGARIIMAGVSQLPSIPFMAIWWSSFLIDVQGSYQSGYAELQNAKKMPNPSFLERFCIFVREQEHTQKASAATSGDNAHFDLVSYVEFQRNYRLAMQLHLDALVARRVFWETLLHHNVTFNKTSSAVQTVETAVRASQRMYRQVLARHSNSIKIVSLYVKFLQDVRNDPWSAARWAAELEKMQLIEEEANERALFGNAAGGMGEFRESDETKGMIIIGANCLIRMINEPAAKMLGFANKNELIGKNVNVMVPPPFSRNHNNYVRNYIQTGRGRVLNTMREAVALHKDRYVLYVTKVSGVGEDSVFMAVVSQLPSEQGTATIWVMHGGMVLSCDSEFTDWLGYRHEDIHGLPIRDLAASNQHALEQLISQIRMEAATSPTGQPAGFVALPSMNGRRVSSSIQKAWSMPSVSLRHMYLDINTEVNIRVAVGGIGDTAMLVCRITRVTDNTPTLLVTDAKGRITHATSKLAAGLGTTASKLQSGGLMHAVDALFPLPFMRMHHLWYRDKTDPIPPWSCRSGLSVCLNGTDAKGAPCVVPYSLAITHKEMQGKEPVNVVQLEARTKDQLLDERRLQLILSSTGHILDASGSPVSLFGFHSSATVGAHLSRLVDVLRLDGDPALRARSQVETEEEVATKMLMRMAEQAYQQPGVSWRVGVTPIIDPQELAGLGPIGRSMMSRSMIPAIMVVEPHLKTPKLDGAQLKLPSELHLKVQLWRADTACGVFELDGQGAIVVSGIKGQAAYEPHLLLGLPRDLLQGLPLASIIPPQGKSMIDALFTEGGLVPLKGAAARGSAAAAAGRGGLKGGMRGGGQMSRRRGCGPVHTVRITHGTDGLDLDLRVQAVVKQDMGTGCSLYVLLHLVQPSVGRPDFRTWLWDASTTAEIMLHKMISVQGARNNSLRDDLLAGAGSKGSLTNLPTSLTAPPGSKLKAKFALPEDEGTPETAHVRRASPRLLENAKAPMPEDRANDGSGSDDSVQHGQKSGARDRISEWISRAELDNMTVAEPDLEPLDVLEEDEDEEEEDKEGDGGTAFQDGDEELEELVEAGSNMNDYKRGKRVKRLTKILMGTQAQLPVRQLQIVSTVLVVVLLVVDLALFLTFQQMTSKQKAQVNDLRQSSRTVSSMMMTSISISAICILLEARFVANIRHLGAGGLQEDLDYQIGLLESRARDMARLHEGVYKGFTKIRQLPEAYKLRSTWQDPILPLRIFYRADNGTFGSDQNMSLWDAGNFMLKCTNNLLQTLRSTYGFATGNNKKVVNSTDVLFVMYNTPRSLIEAYQTTLDGLMQQAIDDSKAMNAIQLVILAVEGAVFGIMSVIIMWVIACKVVFQRYAVFTVFLTVPSGVLRGLATQAFHLDEAERDDDQANQEEGDVGMPGVGGQDLGNPQGSPGTDQDPEQGKPLPGTSLTTATAATVSAAMVSTTSPIGRLLMVLRSAYHAVWTPAQVFHTKRVLKPSLIPVMWITWPFLAWALFVIIINMVGYKHLEAINRPIAVSNIVQFVSIRTDTILFTTQRWVSLQRYDSTFSAQIPADLVGQIRYQGTVLANYRALRLEYTAMLYGHGSAVVAAQTTPHFKLATTGITFSGGADLLFGSGQCLSLDSDDCLMPSDPFYRYTAFGLDMMMRQLFFAVETLMAQNISRLNITQPDFKYIYEIGNSDIRGGLIRLADLYSNSVQSVYQSALNLHVVGLVLCIVMGLSVVLLFVRPAVNQWTQENTRVAELMSALPPEIHVESLVNQALNIRSAQVESAPQLDNSPNRSMRKQASGSDSDSLADELSSSKRG